MEKIVYTVDDIRQLLGIGKNKAYALMNSGVFEVKTIGTTKVVSKKVFYEWLETKNDSKKNNGCVRL